MPRTIYCDRMAGERVAWDYPQSRQAWRSYRTSGLRWLAAGVLCVVLVVGIGQVVLARSRTLLAEGAPTTGTVQAVDEQSVTFEYDAGGQRYTETLDVVSGREYAAGEQVEVRFDRADPGTARLIDEPHRIPGVGPALAGLSLVVLFTVPIGVVVLLRARAWGRAMRREPWTLARLRIRGTDLVLRPGGTGEEVRARIRPTSRWRTKTLQGMDGQELWMLPAGERDLVLTADGTGTVYGLRRRA